MTELDLTQQQWNDLLSDYTGEKLATIILPRGMVWDIYGWLNKVSKIFHSQFIIDHLTSKKNKYIPEYANGLIIFFDSANETFCKVIYPSFTILDEQFNVIVDTKFSLDFFNEYCDQISELNKIDYNLNYVKSEIVIYERFRYTSDTLKRQCETTIKKAYESINDCIADNRKSSCGGQEFQDFFKQIKDNYGTYKKHIADIKKYDEKIDYLKGISMLDTDFNSINAEIINKPNFAISLYHNVW